MGDSTKVSEGANVPGITSTERYVVVRSDRQGGRAVAELCFSTASLEHEFGPQNHEKAAGDMRKGQFSKALAAALGAL